MCEFLQTVCGRLRLVPVNSSCRRLSLTCLCYLWQRDQGELLSEMIGSGLQAILIKVAGIGLTPKHLGKTLGEMQQVLVKLVSSAPSSPFTVLTHDSEHTLRVSYLW